MKFEVSVIENGQIRKIIGGEEKKYEFEDIFFKLTFYVSVHADLCPKLIHNEEHNEASRYRFSEWGY